MQLDLERREEGFGLGGNYVDPSTPLVYVSSYTDYNVLAHTPKGTEGKGIYVLSLNTEKEELNSTGWIVAESNPNPAFMRWCDETKTMYVVNERIDQDGKVFAYMMDKCGRLIPTGEVDAAGRSTCYICRDRSGKWALVTNYWNATISVVRLHPNGELGSIVDVQRRPGYEYCQTRHPDRYEHLRHRQGWSHTHCIVPDPTGECYFVPDLGEDCIHQYKLNRDTGKLSYNGRTDLPAGHGPRHLVVHPHIPVTYVVNELDNSVDILATVTHKLSGGPELTVVQNISTIPPGFEGKTNCAELKVSPNGRFLYVANRFSDTIAIFSINQEDCGKLSMVGIQSSLGCTPRHFAFDPHGKLMIVANTDNDTMVIFRMDESSGLLTYAKTFKVQSPNFVEIVGRTPTGPPIRF